MLLDCLDFQRGCGRSATKMDARMQDVTSSIEHGAFAGALSALHRPSIVTRPALFLPTSPLLSIWEAAAERDALDPEILREILFGLDAPMADDATRLLLRDLPGGEALLQRFFVDRRPNRRFVAISRPLILPTRAAPLLSLPQPFVKDADSSRPKRREFEMPTLQPGQDTSSTPAFPTIEPWRKPIRSTERSRLFAQNMHPVGAPRIGKRGSLVVAALAASIVMLLVLPSRHDVPRPRTTIAANQPAPWLATISPGSSLLSMRTAEPPVQTLMTREPPSNPLAAVTEVSAPTQAASVERTAAEPAQKSAAPSSVLAPASLVVPPPPAQTTIVARDTASPSRPRSARKKASRVAAIATRKRPDVASLVLPDVLKPQ